MSRAFVVFLALGFILTSCSRPPQTPSPEAPPSGTPPQANVPERTNVGNGGSDVLRKFVNLAEDLLHSVNKSEPARSYLARKGIDFDRLNSRWSPKKVFVTRDSIYDYRGSVVDARAATGTIELYEPAWELRFAQGNDQKEVTLHEILRLYSDPGEEPLDDDYQLSRDLLSILRLSDITFMASGNDETWYNTQLSIGDLGCQASLVQGHMDTRSKTLQLSFSNFTLDTLVWGFFDIAYRPAWMFRTFCDLTLRFANPLPVELSHAGMHLTVSEPDSRYMVGANMKSGENILVYHQTVGGTKVVFKREKLGTDVREISMFFTLETSTEAMGKFSIEKAVIPFVVRDKK